MSTSLRPIIDAVAAPHDAPSSAPAKGMARIRGRGMRASQNQNTAGYCHGLEQEGDRALELALRLEGRQRAPWQSARKRGRLELCAPVPVHWPREHAAQCRHECVKRERGGRGAAARTHERRRVELEHEPLERGTRGVARERRTRGRGARGTRVRAVARVNAPRSAS